MKNLNCRRNLEIVLAWLYAIKFEIFDEMDDFIRKFKLINLKSK